MVALRTAQEQSLEANGAPAPSPAPAPAPRSRPKPRRQPIFSIFRPEGLPGEPLPFVRRSALPEHMEYPDTGCEIAPSCLACPLPRCQYDEPGNVRAWLTQARDREIAYIRRRYRVPVNTLARTYGLTRRTIFRILQEQRPKP